MSTLAPLSRLNPLVRSKPAASPAGTSVRETLKLGHGPQAITALERACGDLVLSLNAQGTILAGTAGLPDFDPERVLAGASFLNLIDSEDVASIRAALERALTQGLATDLRTRLAKVEPTKWIQWRFVSYLDERSRPCVMAVGQDVSAQKASEDAMQKMATTDVLTGLPNRALLSDRLRQAIARCKRTGASFAVMALDLDGFKKVNDSMGHPAGDELLVQVAQRLKQVLRETDTLARMGGDEFVALLIDTASPSALRAVDRRVLAALATPFEIQGRQVIIGSSIGISAYPYHGDNEVTLLSRADVALYRAKHAGKGRSVVYDHRWGQQEDDLSIEQAMRRGLSEGEFFIEYQPIVDARTGSPRGLEALLRWTRPGHGCVAPATFIPVAESSGLIGLLGDYALKGACAQLAEARRRLGVPLYVSINVSPRQFRLDSLTRSVEQALELSSLPPDSLMIEITESALMADPEAARESLLRFRAMGIRVAIDDFGTGFSSLAYLINLPADLIKIDRSFVKDVPNDAKLTAICKHIKSLASDLGMSVVAEGVETQAQADALREMSCDLLQGYLFGRPGPAFQVLEPLGLTEQFKQAA